MRFSVKFSVIVGALLFIYIAARAYFLSITHDEALTFDIIQGDLVRATTSNDHVLNTFLVKRFMSVFGEREWVLRAPNVLAYLLYLCFSIKILQRLGSPFFFIAGFGLLHFNPFLMDFFSLARGYGLSIAFMTMGLYYAMRIAREGQFRDGYLSLGLWGGVFAAVLSNYTILVFYLAIFAGYYAHVAFKPEGISLSRRLWANKFGIIANAGFLGSVLLESFRLKNKGQLYFGGDGSFLHEVVGSNLDCLLYFKDYGVLNGWVYWLAVATFVVIAAYYAWESYHRKVESDFMVAGFLLFTMSGIAIAIHHLEGVLYPMERTALFYYPIWVFALVFCFNGLRWKGIQYGVVGLLSACLMLHFLTTMNLSYSYTWFYDRHTKDAVERLEQLHEPGKGMMLGAHWKFGPAINYYRRVKRLDWLNPILIPGFDKRNCYDYYYILESERGDMDSCKGRNILIRQFGDIGAVLLKK